MPSGKKVYLTIKNFIKSGSVYQIYLDLYSSYQLRLKPHPSGFGELEQFQIGVVPDKPNSTSIFETWEKNA